LTFTEGGRTRTITLRATDVEQVSAALARYEAAKADLDAQAEAGLARLRNRDRSGGRP
jgi:hypothetical protein